MKKDLFWFILGSVTFGFGGVGLYYTAKRFLRNKRFETMVLEYEQTTPTDLIKQQEALKQLTKDSPRQFKLLSGLLAMQHPGVSKISGNKFLAKVASDDRGRNIGDPFSDEADSGETPSDLHHLRPRGKSALSLAATAGPHRGQPLRPYQEPKVGREK